MESSKDEIHELLTAIVGSINNTLYDLAAESERGGSKVTAKRLEYSRQKVMTAWEVYNQKRAEKK
ncbi:MULTISPECIES: hypothetical protein [Sporomusa]|jgi:hypothetical protein|uniref:Histone H1-like protein Hc1 n=2 Tax=Sporomusa TaxID=2375 RepID=A0ABM9W506_9FIRM|nr:MULTISPECIES: hypothetical protein [Sporomusa]OLS55987.1 hypothetical protein SPSPH_23740 [Sporomusa sphaeroides DSM 2875]CVK20198.1 hypothetical protein SSPH_02865 [Sporomusa sphaeroides DSM 2875]SCM82770.1 conserved hypothetical protein [uncultured Sporomusa sp.]HML33568.1 hypothetical protein [Sporomusa sphaeroides]